MQPDTTAQGTPGALSLIDKYIARLPISPALARFLIVGGLAFIISETGLLLLYDVLPVLPDKDTRVDFGLFTHPDVRLLIASALSIEAAIFFKFWAHEYWTFRERLRPGSLFARFLQFNASSILSPVILLATVNVLTPVFGISPYISISIGTIIGFAVNWVLSTYIIWPHIRTHTREETGA